MTAAFEATVPEAVAAARKPGPDEDLGVRPRILHLLDEMLHGTLQSSELTPPDFANMVMRSQKQLAAQFAPLGKPTATIFKRETTSPEDASYFYRVEFAADEIEFIVIIDKKTNLVSGLGFRPPQ